MLAIILAGGKGTRMEEYNKLLVKPMIKIAGKPILLWQIECLKREGIQEFLIIAGFRHEQITEYFGDGSDFGVHISYYIEPEPMGTAGALFHLNLPEEFILLNGDLMIDFTLRDMIHFHRQKKADVTLLTHPSSHPFDSTLVNENGEQRVSGLSKQYTPACFSGLSNAGIQIISKTALDFIEPKNRMDLDKDVLNLLIVKTKVYSYHCLEYVKDIGTPERLATVKKEWCAGKSALLRNATPKRAVFTDRDGTVNVLNGYITRPEQIRLIPGVAQAIKQIHALGYLVIVITNQPVLARGDCTAEELEAVHSKLRFLLAEKDTYLDAIYYCPHHPDKGFEGEVKDLKIECGCRKPKPGLILKAAKKWNIDLSASYMIGDSQSDVQAAVNAGCQPVLIGEKENNNAVHYSTLLEFAENLENNEGFIG